MDEDNLKRLTEAAERIALLSPGNKSSSNISVNFGGVGIWIVTTLFIASMVINLCLGIAFLNHDRRIDDLADYIHAIYAVAPQLKPKESP